MDTIRTRIAPSPTGENLHIGNAYTALINYVFAKKHNGKFIIRIEDTDRTRLVEGSQERILESLKWLGLNYDEGPDIGGPCAPYRQSERLPSYKKYAQELVEKERAYYCFCTPERLEEMRKNQQEQGLPPMYDGTCKRIKSVRSRTRIKNENYVIRLNVPDEGVTEFNDVLRGKISFENKLIDDQVLLKSDGFPTYHLGVVVDDYLMKITHIIRGEEWISSTPKHILLYKAFGWGFPVFAHVPLLRNPDKSKLSKRKNPVWVSWYRKQGVLPEALINYLALLGWAMPDGRDIFTREELIQEFALEKMKTTAPIFDIEKLKWLNKKYIQIFSEKNQEELILTIKEFSKYASQKKFAEILRKILPLVCPRISLLSEFDQMAGFFYERPEKYELDLRPHKNLLEKSYDALVRVDSQKWKGTDIGKVLQKLAKNMGVSNTDFFMAIRVAITGRKVSPPLNDSIEIVGKEETIRRIEIASQ